MSILYLVFYTARRYYIRYKQGHWRPNVGTLSRLQVRGGRANLWTEKPVYPRLDGI